MTLHSLSPDAMKSYSDGSPRCSPRETPFREAWRTDGMAWTEMQDGKPRSVPRFLRLHRRHQHDHHSRRSRAICAGSPAAVRNLALRFARRAENYFVPEPRELVSTEALLSLKSSRQTSLDSRISCNSNKDKIDPELLAAKICGRWRNGVPLALSPEQIILRWHFHSNS